MSPPTPRPPEVTLSRARPGRRETSCKIRDLLSKNDNYGGLGDMINTDFVAQPSLLFMDGHLRLNKGVYLGFLAEAKELWHGVGLIEVLCRI